MSQTRKDVIDKAFQAMDKTGDGVITVEDLKLNYNVRQHPKFLSGEKSEDELYKKFLDVFQPGDTDDKVRRRQQQQLLLLQQQLLLLAANRGSNCSLTRAMDGRIVRCGIITSCQSAATSETVKRFWSRVWLMWAPFIATQVNLTGRPVELGCVAINGA